MTPNSQKLISILGTTAAGKTDLALFLARQFIKDKLTSGVTLISADSRQVYQGLEILTGADIPADFIFKKNTAKNTYRFAQHQTLPITLHGVSIISPEQEWSVAHFRDLTIHLIRHSWAKKFLPIIVGGTSFYHSQLFNNDPDIYIKPKATIRQQIAQLTVEQLQNKLKQLDAQKFNQMNQSDRNNPRRLIRAIEIGLQKTNLSTRAQNRPIFHKPDDYCSIALQLKAAALEKRITHRVKARIKNGAVTEVKNLLQLDLEATAPVMTTLGVKPIQKYLHNKITKQQMIHQWIQSEIQYVKQQITWLKKLPADLQPNLEASSYQKKTYTNIIEQLNV